MGNTSHSTDRVTDSFDTRSLHRGLQEYGLDNYEDVSRDEVRELVDENGKDITQHLRHGARLLTADGIGNKLENIEGLETPQSNAAAQQLSISELAYYRSFFTYTNHTTRVHKVPTWDGLLAKIADEADTVSEAEEIFWSAYDDGEVPEKIAKATEDLPAPLIGNISSGFHPRVLRFEDENHIYVEYWSRGGVKQGFDIDSGEHETINTPYRAAIRIHLDSRLIESTGDKPKAHDSEINDFLTSLNGNPMNSDIELGESDIEKVKEDLALVVTLDEFAGEDAKLRFSRNEQDGNVEADPIHEQTADSRLQIRSNFQIFLGRTDEGLELINPSSIAERYTNEGSIKISSVREDIERSETYNEVMNLTVGLNNEKSTVRIRKSSLTPSTRREIFHIFAERLNWR